VSTEQVPTGVESPPTHECWAMLRTATLGRLAFAVDEEVEIFPLNFAVDQGSVVFRTSSSSRIGLCLDGRGVAFEADGLIDGQAWSVVVKGHAKEIRSIEDSLAAAQLPVHPLQAGSKPRLVRIVADALTGRRFATAEPQQSILGSAPHSAPE
jgi:uncharacterized protein